MHLDKTLRFDTILGSPNLAEKFTDQDLKKIGSEIYDGYDTDKLSRKNWDDNVDKWIEMALQAKDPKSYPWPKAANVKYPLITTAALQFSARAYPALLPGTSPVRGRVIGYDDNGEKVERSIRVGKHMSYQLLEEMEDWEEEMDRLLFALPIVGCMFKKTYWDKVKGLNVSEIVYPKELVVNYWSKNLEEAERITHELRMTENDIYERIAAGTYIEQDIEETTTQEIKPSEKVSGVEQPQKKDKTTPYLLLEQCVYLDLDQDDYKEPYIVTIDSETHKVLRIVPRFNEEDVQYTEDGKILRINPVQYYTKFSFIPSPDGGFYDIGFGVLLGPINHTINTLINQLLDAGTLSNMQSGFVAKGIRIKGGNYKFTPGEWKQANSVGDDLRKGLVPLPVREPSQVLFSLLGMMIESGDKLSTVTEVMTGEIPGQNTKATVAMAAIEQGMKVFSSIYKRIHRSLSKEYKKLFKLNSRFLPPESYFTILDRGAEGAEEIRLADYAMGDIDIVPTSDPNVATEQQKIAKVEALGQLLQMGTINPQEFTKRYLDAIEIPNPEALTEMPEQGPSPEELALQFEQQKFQDESERAWEELDIARQKAEATALKDIATAEAAEIGDQLEEYRAQLKVMQDDDLAHMKVTQMQEDHQRKMQQQAEAHQQKMAQQEEINRQKAAQERNKTLQLKDVQRDAEGNISGATINEQRSIQ